MTESACYAQTMPGAEEIAWLEIRARLLRAKFGEYLYAKEQNGIVLFTHAGTLDDLLHLRTVEDVFLHAFNLPKISRDWRDLRQIGQTVRESTTFEHAFHTVAGRRRGGGKATYRVISRKYGTHQYRRMDVEEATVKAIHERFGRRYRLVDDNADVEVWINVLGSTVLCGVRVSDATMRHRTYKSVHLPASLRPSVAGAMVWLTDPQPDDVFLDPMCGGGTLLAERALLGDYAKLLGGDNDPTRSTASKKILHTVDARNWEVRQWDAAQLPLADNSVSSIATNLPFGKQIGSKKSVRKLYPRVFGEMARVLQPGRRAVVLSSEFDLVKDVVRHQTSLEIVRGYSIAVLGQWGRIYIILKK